MSNERIDLTQFEESFGSLLDAVLGGTCTLEDGEGHLHDRMQVILAELKRCYEELDEANKEGEAVWNVLENWDICTDDYSMHDLYNNLDEKYARDDEGRIILKELYSYTEEDGWQPKETASQ